MSVLEKYRDYSVHWIHESLTEDGTADFFVTDRQTFVKYVFTVDLRRDFAKNYLSNNKSASLFGKDQWFLNDNLVVEDISENRISFSSEEAYNELALNHWKTKLSDQKDTIDEIEQLELRVESLKKKVVDHEQVKLRVVYYTLMKRADEIKSMNLF